MSCTTGGNITKNINIKTIYIIAALVVIALLSGCIGNEKASQNTQVNPVSTSQVTVPANTNPASSGSIVSNKVQSTPVKASPTPGNSAVAQTGLGYLKLKVTPLSTADCKPQKQLTSEDPGNNIYTLDSGNCMVVDVSESKFPKPPVIYQFDITRDGIVDTPFYSGLGFDVFSRKYFYWTKPTAPTCIANVDGETCLVKIQGTDSAGNKDQVNLKIRTVYK